MNSFINRMKECDDYMELGGVSEENIKKAEAMLGISFADDYRVYLAECGIATADGHEFTGLGRAKRLDVVTATLSARKENSNIPENMYIVESIGIDGLQLWQDSKGNMYQYMPNGGMEKIADSLLECFFD